MELNYESLGLPTLRGNPRYNNRALEGIAQAYGTLGRFGELIAPTNLGMNLMEVETPQRTEGRLVFSGNARYYDGGQLSNERPIKVVVDGDRVLVRTNDNHTPSRKLAEGLAELVGQDKSGVIFRGSHYEARLELGDKVAHEPSQQTEIQQGMFGKGKIPRGYLAC